MLDEAGVSNAMARSGATLRENSQDPSAGGSAPALTGPPQSVQLSATNDTPEPLSEHDQTIVNAFLDTLARVALAVAGRRSSSHTDEGEKVEP